MLGVKTGAGGKDFPSNSLLDAFGGASVHRLYDGWRVQLDEDVRGGMTLGIYAWATFHAHVPLPPVPPFPPMVLQLLNTAALSSCVKIDVGVIDEESPNWWRSVRFEQPVKLATFAAMPLRLRRLEWAVTAVDDDADECWRVQARRATIPHGLLSFPACRTLRHLTLHWPTTVRLLEASALLSLQSLELVGAKSDPGDHMDLRALLGASPEIGSLLRRLRKLRLYYADVDFSFLADCCGSTLEELYISVSTVTSVPSLARFVSLRVLHVRMSVDLESGSDPGDAAATSLVCLAESKTLEEVDFTEADVCDGTLCGIGAIPTLRRLRLAGEWTSVAVEHCLASSTSLTALDVECWNRATAEAVDLERIPTLTSLRNSGYYFLDSKTLASCARLVNLDLSESDVTAEDLEGVERISTLRQLRLWRCDSLTAVHCLAGSTSLERLDLSASAVTSEGLAGLERIPTLKVVWMCDCENVTALNSLTRSISLQTLVLEGSGVSEAVRNELVARFPMSMALCRFSSGRASQYPAVDTYSDTPIGSIIPSPITAYTPARYSFSKGLRKCSPL